MKKKVLHKENEYLRVEIYSNARVQILNKKDNKVWSMDYRNMQEQGSIAVGCVWYRRKRELPEQYSAQFFVQEQSGRLLYELYDCADQKRGTFECEIILDEKWIRFRVYNISDTLESLAFPTAIKSESLVIPIHQGKWVRKPQKESYYYPALGEGTSMRWFGGLSGEKGWIGIITKCVADAGMLTTKMEITPVWLRSLNKWQDVKEMSYTFVESGGYVALAKVFREYAKQNGLFKSLKEKIAEVGNVGKIIKGRDVYFCQSKPVVPEDEAEYNLYSRKQIDPEDKQNSKFKDFVEASNTIDTEVYMTHKQVAQKVRELEKADTKGLIQLGGWLNSGYDGRYPDIWPFNPQLGDEDEFKHVFKAARVIAIGIHDNYQDIYKIAPSFPKGVNINKDGTYMRGGVWDHQAYILNSRDSLKYQQRNWEYLKDLGLQFVYSDTICAAALYESYEEGNTLTRAQDMEYKQQLMKFYKDKELIMGTEIGADFGIPYVDWLASNAPHTVGETIPLFGLVYHDAVVNGNGVYDDFDNITPEGSYPALLKMMLWGDQLHYWVVGEDGWQKYLQMAEKSRYLDEWYEEIATEEMLNHRYVTEDGKVEETTFESGKKITVNFSTEEVDVDGIHLPAQGYVITRL